MRLIILAMGLIAGVGGLFVFVESDLLLIPPCLLMIVAIIYLLAIKAMFWQYVSLIAQGLTLKEKVSRMEACYTYSLEDTVKQKMSKRQKMRNICKFIFKKKQ